MSARTTTILGLLASLGLAHLARADLAITWHSIDGGGVQAASAGAFTLGATIGQHDAYSTVHVGSLDVTGGYWAAATTPCHADFDHSGFVDLDDFIAFVAAFDAGTDDADFDRSGFVDLDDFIAFVGAFETGC